MIKTFFTRYFIETPNSFNNREDIINNKFSNIRFKLPDSDVIFYDHKGGLGVDSYTKADSKDEVLNKTKNLAENIINIIDFTNSSGSNPAIFQSVYDATENVAEREYEQVFYVPLPERNIRITNITNITKMFNIFGDVFDKNELRVVRAIYWFKTGLFEKNDVEKFISFWTGLESINELLCDHFKLTEEERKWKCNKCKTTLLSISNIGVKKLFLDVLKIKKDDFQKIRDARNDLIHGRNLSGINSVKEIAGFQLIVKKALITGIGLLLKIEDDIIEKIMGYTPIKYIDNYRIIIKLNLLDFDVPLLEEIDKQPEVNLDNNILKTEINEEGNLDIKGEVAFNFKKLKFNHGAYEVWGDDFSKIIKAKFEGKKFNG